jgi:hypothetical protein
VKPSTSILRKASSLLRELADEFLKGFPREVEARRLADLLLPRRWVKTNLPFKTRAVEKEEDRLAQNEETDRIRAECMLRANGRCECGCGRRLDLWGATMDHWLSGSGQRVPKQSVKTCWILTLKCHLGRQTNSPSVAFWNERFQRHCISTATRSARTSSTSR